MQAFHFDSVDSTNEAGKRLLAGSSIRDSAYVLAREQTAGKGTQGRRWVSPKDAGVYLSVVHTNGHTEIPTSAHYALSAGVACVETLMEVACVSARIKPINDLVVDSRKLGGILTEAVVQGGKTTALITGVGLNIRRAERVLPPGTWTPVCLEEILPAERITERTIQSLIEVLVERIDRWHGEVIAGRIDGINEEWLRWALLGSILPPDAKKQTVPIRAAKRRQHPDENGHDESAGG